MPCAPSRGVQCAGVACMHDSSQRLTSLACIRCHDCMQHGAPLLLCRPASRIHSTGRSQHFQARCLCLPAAGPAPRGLGHSCGRTLLRCLTHCLRSSSAAASSALGIPPCAPAPPYRHRSASVRAHCQEGDSHYVRKRAAASRLCAMLTPCLPISSAMRR